MLRVPLTAQPGTEREGAGTCRETRVPGQPEPGESPDAKWCKTSQEDKASAGRQGASAAPHTGCGDTNAPRPPEPGASIVVNLSLSFRDTLIIFMPRTFLHVSGLQDLVFFCNFPRRRQEKRPVDPTRACKAIISPPARSLFSSRNTTPVYYVKSAILPPRNSHGCTLENVFLCLL